MTIERVLLVEDDVAIASGVATLLELEGIHVRVVETGRDVARITAAFRPDALVLDLSLPDVDGIVVYREVRRAFPSLAIIISSGTLDGDTPSDAGRTAYLQKPYEFATLLATLRKLTV